MSDNIYARLETLTRENRELREKNYLLQCQMKELRERLDETKEDLQNHIDALDAFEAIEEGNKKGLLDNIADSLSYLYDDYKDSLSDDMDIELGEICRGHLRDIFFILNRKFGVKMEHD